MIYQKENTQTYLGKENVKILNWLVLLCMLFLFYKYGYTKNKLLICTTHGLITFVIKTCIFCRNIRFKEQFDL